MIYTIQHLVIFRNLKTDPMIEKAAQLIEQMETESLGRESGEIFFEICHVLLENAEQYQWSGDLWKNYLLWQMIMDPNVLHQTIEREGKISESLRQALFHDMNILKSLFEMQWDAFGGDSHHLLTEYVPTGNRLLYTQSFGRCWEELQKTFTSEKALEDWVSSYLAYIQQMGYGSQSLYRAFRWEAAKGLVGINNPDPTTFGDLIGYELQKQALIQNTEAFLSGGRGNHVLLYGDKGTGKSSSVKALLNHFYPRGLKVIELMKNQIMELPCILELVKYRHGYFIIFMDDLSFEDFEIEYKYFKAVMEGGIEQKPDNVLIYATSNRRHLIKENWKDRQEVDGEVHISDSAQEKLSLADRFGLTLTYLSPNQEEYLEIVRELAKKQGLSLAEETLKKRAIQWELIHGGRSGRTAQQLMNTLTGQD